MASPSPKRTKSFTSMLHRSPKRSAGKKSRSSQDETDEGTRRKSPNGILMPLQLPTEYAMKTRTPTPVEGYVAVVAIDFGTTYSGCAYAFTRDPTNIHLLRQYSRRTLGVQQPTVLLLTPDRHFHSFGYEAQEYYHDIDDEDAADWLYFEKFKMELHSRQHLHEGMELVATNGERVRALQVFAHALQYFKDTCLREIEEQSTSHITASDIRWVITVPAIWRESAKQFMRKAAVEAGLVLPDNPKQLVIALEPEAASVFCRKLQLRECVSSSSPTSISPNLTPSPSTGARRYPSLSPPSLGSSSGSSNNSSPLHTPLSHSGHSMSSISSSVNRAAADIRPGVCYLVADCGGGTVDLTVHQVSQNGQLKELFKATGGAWGSIGVDCQFEWLLEQIFGQRFIKDFIKTYPVNWLEIMSSFEAKKRSFDPKRYHPSNISLPYSFIEHYRLMGKRTVSKAVAAYGDSNIQWTSQGMLRLSTNAMLQLFKPVVNSIVKNIDRLVKQSEQPLEYLFLVGGFSESPVLQQAVRDSFSTLLQVIIPQDISLTILKGAVMFGIDPGLVNIRRSAMTYGVGCLHHFDPNMHPPEKKVVRDGKNWCTDIFDLFVTTGQPIPHGHCITRAYNPARSAIKSTVISLFATEKENVNFVTDPGVKKIGELRLEMPDTTGGRNRELCTTMLFGDTEISVQAIDITSGQTATALANFLFEQ